MSEFGRFATCFGGSPLDRQPVGLPAVVEVEVDVGLAATTAKPLDLRGDRARPQRGPLAGLVARGSADICTGRRGRPRGPPGLPACPGCLATTSGRGVGAS